LSLSFERHEVHLLLLAEIDDRALMKSFDERGTGVFTSPTAVEHDVLDKYGVAVVARTEKIGKRFLRHICRTPHQARRGYRHQGSGALSAFRIG
jgi:hypothetical protein